MGGVVKKVVKASSLGMVDLDDKPSAPKLAKTKTAPVADDEEAMKAQLRAQGRRRRTGRTSTVLSEGSGLG